MSSYTDDVSEEFDDFEDMVGVAEISLLSYIEWLEEVISVANMRLQAAKSEIQ